MYFSHGSCLTLMLVIIKNYGREVETDIHQFLNLMVNQLLHVSNMLQVSTYGILLGEVRADFTFIIILTFWWYLIFSGNLNEALIYQTNKICCRCPSPFGTLSSCVNCYCVIIHSSISIITIISEIFQIYSYF